MWSKSTRPSFVVLACAGLLVCVPALLRSSPQKSPSPQAKVTAQKALEARLAALEADSREQAEAIEGLTKLTTEQGKALEEADLRLSRMANEIKEFAVATKVDKALAGMRQELQALQGREGDFDQVRQAANSLADEVQRVKNETEELRRKVGDTSDVERKIDSVRDLARKCEDKIRDLERRDDKHDDRLARLEAKGR